MRSSPMTKPTSSNVRASGPSSTPLRLPRPCGAASMLTDRIAYVSADFRMHMASLMASVFEQHDKTRSGRGGAFNGGRRMSEARAGSAFIPVQGRDDGDVARLFATRSRYRRRPDGPHEKGPDAGLRPSPRRSRSLTWDPATMGASYIDCIIATRSLRRPTGRRST
jgi:hypothetical protein